MSTKLVAYFSFAGHTQKAAEGLAKLVGADLYRIEPEQAYTKADLDWHNDTSRSTLENNNPNARPKLLGSVPDMSQYTTVYLGFPIWYGVAPRIVNTFADQANLSDKTVALFCTSGGSPIDYAAHQFEATYTDIKVSAAERISGSPDHDLL